MINRGNIEEKPKVREGLTLMGRYVSKIVGRIKNKLLTTKKSFYVIAKFFDYVEKTKIKLYVTIIRLTLTYG